MMNTTQVPVVRWKKVSSERELPVKYIYIAVPLASQHVSGSLNMRKFLENNDAQQVESRTVISDTDIAHGQFDQIATLVEKFEDFELHVIECSQTESDRFISKGISSSPEKLKEIINDVVSTYTMTTDKAIQIKSINLNTMFSGGRDESMPLKSNATHESTSPNMCINCWPF